MSLIHEIIFCVLSNNKCIYHLDLGRFPLYCITIITISRVGVKINVSRKVIKLDFDLDLLFKMVPERLFIYICVIEILGHKMRNSWSRC